MEDQARAHLIIEGRVQGVFFRAFTRDLALTLGLKGWVRNLPSGDVEVVFEGERTAVEEAIGQCHAGPPSGRVDNVDVTWENPRGEFSSFTVKY
jgi:acylphosphatase